jgi:hypothetical protein
MLKRPTSKNRNAVVTFVAGLLRGFPADSTFPDLLFRDADKPSNESSKPFSYIFINLVLIDIRTTIPSLMEILASTSYSTTALRLAASYDIASSFIMYLLQNLGDDVNFSETSQFTAILAPDLLLKLRRDFSETFSLTLEYFRDRWEATVTGVSGLDASARIDPEAPLALTWDNPSVPPSEDPIILAGLRALSLWLREDDNPELHEQAVGAIDMLVPLYLSSTLPNSKIDFRHAILTAFSGIFPSSEDAVQSFLNHEGWDALANDLKQCFRSFGRRGSQSVPVHTQDLIRVLILVVESDTVPQSLKSWIDTIRLVANCAVPSIYHYELLEALIGGWQLAIALFVKAPINMKNKVIEEVKSIKIKAKIFMKNENKKLSANQREGLEEITSELDTLIYKYSK